MYEATAESLYLEGSKSPDLAAALDLVAECEVKGEPKFTAKACHLLCRMIVCRNYATAILELCHLVVLAEACGSRPGSYEAFFWGSGPARPDRFRTHVSRCPAQRLVDGRSIQVHAREVTIHYADGSFSIAFGRMPVLSALMEFLVTALGYGTLDDHCQPHLAAGPTKASVSTTAKEISKRLYDYLNKHLGSLHNHRKFTSLMAFLRDRQGGNFSSDTIDDAAVLAFWTAHAGSSGKADEFRTYIAVFRGFLRLRQSLEAAAEVVALSNPKPIGCDRSKGEVDPAEVVTTVETVESRSQPLEKLEQPQADRVKFLTKSEAAALQLLVDCGRLAPYFVLSVMRAEVFGSAQARITQACRRGLAIDRLGQVIEGSLRQTYDGQRANYERLHGQLRKILLASLYALVIAQRAEGINLILAFRPKVDWRPLSRQLAVGPTHGNVVSIDGTQLARQVLVALAKGEPGCPELAELMREARRAFQSVSRRGFDEEGLRSGDSAQAFADGVGALDEVAQCLKAFLNVLDRMALPCGTWSRQFDDDEEQFRTQFHRIYGASL